METMAHHENPLFAAFCKYRKVTCREMDAMFASWSNHDANCPTYDFVHFRGWLSKVREQCRMDRPDIFFCDQRGKASYDIGNINDWYSYVIEFNGQLTEEL